LGEVELVDVVTYRPLGREGLGRVILGAGGIETAEEALSGHLGMLSTFFIQGFTRGILACAPETAVLNSVVAKSWLIFTLRRHGICTEAESVALWWCEEVLLRCGGESVPAAGSRREPVEVKGSVKDSFKTLILELSLYISPKIRLHTIKSAYLKW
jgi:hypothetical protein